MAAALALAALVFTVGCGGAEQAAGGAAASATTASVARSEAAPFSGSLLDGTSVSLESYRGKPLALIFWATW